MLLSIFGRPPLAFLPRFVPLEELETPENGEEPVDWDMDIDMDCCCCCWAGGGACWCWMVGGPALYDWGGAGPRDWLCAPPGMGGGGPVLGGAFFFLSFFCTRRRSSLAS